MTTMSVKDVLIAARAKIADPANWTQGSYARDRHGDPMRETSDEAVCWCAVGAIYISARPIAGIEVHLPAEALRAVIGGPVSKFNDTHTHAEVLAKFDEAIAAQGGE